MRKIESQVFLKDDLTNILRALRLVVAYAPGVETGQSADYRAGFAAGISAVETALGIGAVGATLKASFGPLLPMSGDEESTS
jgi:hypothetical protein